MPSPQNIRRSGFTLQFDRRTLVLSSEIGITEAYDPGSGTPALKVIKFRAIWDTGASGSVITQNVISALKLEPIDEKDVETANGKRVADVYLVNIYLPNKVACHGVRVTDGDILATDVLVGMDIIGSGDFAVTHSDGRTCMSFQIPSHNKIDFVQEIEATPIKKQKRRRRPKKPWERKHRN